jgi:hypothetical protein
MRHFSLLGIALLTLSFSASARAEEGTSTSGAAPTPAQVPEATTSHWYGWQNLLCDAGALGLVLGGAALTTEYAEDHFSASTPTVAPYVMGAGAVTYAVCSPAVHYAHGGRGQAGGALGLRIGLPVAGALVGSKLESCPQHEDAGFCGTGLFVGLGVGIVSAIALDVALLAYEDVSPKPSSSAWTVSPTWAIAPGRATFGMMGAF